MQSEKEGMMKKIRYILTRGEISERAVGEVQLRDVGSDAGEAFGVVLLLLGGFDALLLLLWLLLVVGGAAADPQTLQTVGGQVAHHALAAAAAVRESGRGERVVEREQHQVQLRGHVHHRHPHLPDAAPGVALLPVHRIKRKIISNGRCDAMRRAAKRVGLGFFSETGLMRFTTHGVVRV
jgi:hypothetical protein